MVNLRSETTNFEGFVQRLMAFEFYFKYRLSRKCTLMQQRTVWSFQDNLAEMDVSGFN